MLSLAAMSLGTTFLLWSSLMHLKIKHYMKESMMLLVTMFGSFLGPGKYLL